MSTATVPRGAAFDAAGRPAGVARNPDCRYGPDDPD